MLSNEEHFFNKPKVQQLIIQFAFKIPLRKELTEGEKKALENVLKSLDRETFQLFDEPSQRNPGCLFQVLHQLPVEASTITLPSFIFSNDSFSFIFPLKMIGKLLPRIGSIDAKDISQKLSSNWILKLQNSIANLNCQRTGKIYDIVLGPFNQEEKTKIFKQLFVANLSDVGELNLTFAKYHKENTEVYNIQTNIRYLQNNLNDNFFINARIDINNRNLSTSLEPGEVEKVWNFADSTISEYLNSILEI